MDLDEAAIADMAGAEPPALSAAAETLDDRTTVRDDGTLVIDILVRPPCGQSTEGEIVVCAPDAEAHRLAELDEPEVKEPPRAEIALGDNAKAGLRAETETIQGTKIDRIMLDLGIAF